MAKLSNGLEYQNIYLPAEYCEYLLSNQYVCTAMSSDTLFFDNGKVNVMVKNDNVDVFRFVINEDNVNGKLLYSSSHTCISQLGLFNWIMLMHIMKVQSIAGFIKNAEKAGHQVATEAMFLTQSIINSQLQPC